jgi:curved DNA-binding protein CbpA
MRFFENVNCIEELKRQYFALAKKYHSDITGGSDEDMKALNNEYSDLQKKYKDVHASIKEDSEAPYYTAKESTNEAPEDFINIIAFILSLKGVEVELCGRWIWISGDTKQHKDLLKEMGCKWAQNKKMWSWHYNGDKSGYSKRKCKDMGYIRNVYGSVSYRTDEQLLLA